MTGPVRFGVVVFPGSNCDADCYHAVAAVTGQPVRYVWHREERLDDLDCVVLPGGFSYGDYLRAGAIARFSPVMGALRRFAAAGGPVIGICNGFQILLEAGLLPGAMQKNDTLSFRCEHVYVRVEDTSLPFTCCARPGQVLALPIAHYEGNYYAPPADLARLAAGRGGRIAFRYCDRTGRASAAANPNGSAMNIAGIADEGGNVLGLMPHPERAVEAVLGSGDGRVVFESVVDHCRRGAAGGRCRHADA